MTFDTSEMVGYECSERNCPDTDPDVSGIGVIIGFVGSGMVIVLLLLLHLIFIYDPELDQFRKPEEPKRKAEHPNFIDMAVLRRLRVALRAIGLDVSDLSGKTRGTAWEKAFNKCILSMADIQIITGLAVLISGFHGLRNISGYHWLMVTYTAWFSAVTHVAALSHLRNYYSNHLERCIWRLIFMLLVVILLVGAMIIGVPIKSHMSGPFWWIQTNPAMSFWEEDTRPWNYYIGESEKLLTFDPSSYGDKTNSCLQTALSGMMLVFSFISRVVKMSRGTSALLRKLRQRVRNKVVVIVKGGRARRWIGSPPYTFLVARPVAAAWLFGRAYSELFGSFLAEVFWVLVTTFWGLTHLVRIRARAQVAFDYSQHCDCPSNENDWSFGQVAAVVLFSSPLFMVIETFITFNPKRHGASRLDSLPQTDEPTAAQVPESTRKETDDRNTPIEVTRLLDSASNWESPSFHIAIFAITGFNFILVAFMFVFTFAYFGRGDALPRLAPCHVLYQPLIGILVLLVGLEWEGKGSQRHRWVQYWTSGSILLLDLGYIVWEISSTAKSSDSYDGYLRDESFSVSIMILIILAAEYSLYSLVCVTGRVFTRRFSRRSNMSSG
ncbi:hypothetical protein BDP81DRAFT_395495 [Colletotrichum phormii]|uniref:Uncharacterized protein n=1 Tax=Colletotrichum phormii TaxID=359342 RepID=A0AAJ0EFF0_9PEZI|nr:uncharacterized protein BDP81DRAFT_395495 [Colletotrichum phormii]KAK1635021.1 hypothetical protein BDP81DRAFT_395495 [Colletotrichum phormii]